MLERITLRHGALLVFAGCCAALTVAVVGERVFGLQPCVLCLIERLPFVAGALLSAVAFLAPRRLTGVGRVALGVAGVAFLVNSGIAFFHVGVEQHWWSSACSSAFLPDTPVDDLAAQINMEVTGPSCDAPSFSWNGITFATLNVVYCLVLGALSLTFALMQRRSVGPQWA